MNLVGDTDAAMEFLEFMHPGRRWGLTAIPSHRKGIENRVFEPDDRAAAREFIERHNGKSNLYFSVNTLLKGTIGKASRADIEQVNFFHVDIDPRPREDIAAEQVRIRELLTTRLPLGVLVPTVVVFSGGGLQAFWRLRTPMPINGDLDTAEGAKLYNVALENSLGADRTHDVSRIMRIPFTVNLPDAGKIQKGRQPALASVEFRDADRVYDLREFTPAPPFRSDQTGTLGKPGSIGAAPVFGLSPRRLNELDDLDEWSISERVKIVIAQGRHPDETKGPDDSRSAWLFDAVCALIRSSVPDEVILGLLLDDRFGLSQSVLDKGVSAERYALRQIERAHEAVICPHLMALNERHFVIENDGGRCKVAEWVRSPGQDREQISLQSFEDFKNRYGNIFVDVTSADGRPVKMPLGRYWILHPKRRQFRGLVMQPSGPPVINGHLNLWRGFRVEPAPGSWDLTRRHIVEVLACGDADLADYIIRWAAWAVQNPDKPAEVALVFQGEEGTGKGTFARALTSLFGQHGFQATSPSQFAGRFNSHLRDVCILFADEAINPEDRVSRGVLKTLLTEPYLPSEAKGRDIVQVRNHIKVVMASNERWVAPVGVGDRRFAVFRVSPCRKGDYKYFADLNNEISANGLAAMLHDLLNMELGDWHPRSAIPQTGARNEQRAATLDGIESIFLDLLQAGVLPSANSVGGGCAFCSTNTLREYAAQRLRRSDVTLNQVANLLTTLGFTKDHRKRPRGYIMPALPEARALWNERMFEVVWNDLTEWDFVPNQDPPF